MQINAGAVSDEGQRAGMHNGRSVGRVKRAATGHPAALFLLDLIRFPRRAKLSAY